MKNVKITALLLTIVMIFSLFAGCGGKNAGQAANDSNAKASSQKTETATLPIVKEPLKITFYTKNAQSKYIKSYDEVECYKEIQNRTGIDIEWVHPSADEQLNLMMASGDLPDLIFNNWGTSISKYVDDNIAVKLNDYIDKYAPDIKKMFTDTPMIKKQLELDDGTIPMFPQVDMNLERNIYRGLMVRGDWLEALNMKMPVTIDDWYNTLKAFKEKDPNGNGKADEIPYSDEKGGGIKMFAGAWGVRDTFYNDPKTKKVVYGPIQPGYKDYLSTMAKWYKEGLIDKEYGLVDRKALDSKVLDNTAGSYYGTNSYLENYMVLAKAKNPKFSVNAAPFPVGPAGKAYNLVDQSIRHISGYGTLMSVNCKHPVEATKLVNYMMSEEGTTLQSWGIEGKSYVVENGKKKYTDDIMHNKENKTATDALVKYALPNGLAKIFILENYMALNSENSKQWSDSMKVWGAADTSMLMPILLFKYDENQKYSTIMSEVNTYTDQMFTKFIMGVETLDKFDEYVKTIKKMGIDDAIKIQQDAYDRFQARK